MIETTGNIIKIIDEYRVAINIGKDFISKNDTVYVYDKNNLIKDIDGRILGKYDFLKTELIATEVYDNFSICESIKTEYNNFNRFLILSPVLEKQVTQQRLNIDDATLQRINTVDKIIRVGDIVKLK